MTSGTTMVLTVAILCVFILKVLAILTRRAGQLDSQRMTQDEADTLRRLDEGLARMERRIEALETILTDPAMRR